MPPTPKAKIITVTGPSGVGKTTIVCELFAAKPELAFVVSLTSRAPRDSDLPGEYRCSVAEDEFARRSANGEFLWTVDAHGNTYGTLVASVDEALEREQPSLMILVPDRVEFIRRRAPDQVLSFFIVPPQETILRERLARRGESPEVIERRIADCKAWTDDARSSHIPYTFIGNDGSVGDAVRQLLAHLS
ncbi:MAG: hypothetical protein AAB562_01730 [Patescibacteria group bacterium]